MNRFEKLLEKLSKKIDLVQTLCAELIPLSGAEQVLEQLVTVVSILRKPNAVMNKRTCGFVGAMAERTIETLSNLEQRFLISLCTSDSLKIRIRALHPEAFKVRSEQIWGAVNDFDALRTNSNASIDVLREKYLEANSILQKAEALTKQIRLDEIADRLQETILSGVVGSIKPTKKGRSADKRLADAHRRSNMKGTTNGSKKNQKKFA